MVVRLNELQQLVGASVEFVIQLWNMLFGL